MTQFPVPEYLPDFIEDTEPYTKDAVLTSDLVIIFALHPDRTPAFAACAAESGAGAIIASGSDTSELRKIRDRYRIHIHADEICCSLEPFGDHRGHIVRLSNFVTCNASCAAYCGGIAIYEPIVFKCYGLSAVNLLMVSTSVP